MDTLGIAPTYRLPSEYHGRDGGPRESPWRGNGIGPVTRGISIRPIRGVARAWRGACSHRESLCCATLMMVLADR